MSREALFAHDPPDFFVSQRKFRTVVVALLVINLGALIYIDYTNRKMVASLREEYREELVKLRTEVAVLRAEIAAKSHIPGREL